jgi:hypothetical protein
MPLQARRARQVCNSRAADARERATAPRGASAPIKPPGATRGSLRLPVIGVLRRPDGSPGSPRAAPRGVAARGAGGAFRGPGGKMGHSGGLNHLALARGLLCELEYNKPDIYVITTKL